MASFKISTPCWSPSPPLPSTDLVLPRIPPQVSMYSPTQSWRCHFTNHPSNIKYKDISIPKLAQTRIGEWRERIVYKEMLSLHIFVKRNETLKSKIESENEEKGIIENRTSRFSFLTLSIFQVKIIPSYFCKSNMQEHIMYLNLANEITTVRKKSTYQSH